MNYCRKINLGKLILFVFLILLVFTLTGCLLDSEKNKTYKTTKKKDVDLATIEQAKNTIQSFFISYEDGNSKEMSSLLVGKAADKFNGKLDAIPYDYDITKAKELASGLFSFEVTTYFKGGKNGSYSEDWTYKVAAKTDEGYMRIYERNQKHAASVNLKGLVVTLERTPCFGACPTYKLTIKGRGVVIYKGKESVKVKGKRISMMSKDKVKDLVSAFDEANFFSLKGRYDKTTATDMPSAITSITMSGKHKTVYHYQGDDTAPKPLTKLENKIDEFAKTDKWIGKD